MDEADRTCATGLAALRRAAELTQAELARRMGVTQAAVSRMEQPHDLLLSTLTAYLAAVGGRAVVMVRFADGHETQLDLSPRSLLASRLAAVAAGRCGCVGPLAHVRLRVADILSVPCGRMYGWLTESLSRCAARASHNRSRT